MMMRMAGLPLIASRCSERGILAQILHATRRLPGRNGSTSSRNAVIGFAEKIVSHRRG